MVGVSKENSMSEIRTEVGLKSDFEVCQCRIKVKTNEPIVIEQNLCIYISFTNTFESMHV